MWTDPAVFLFEVIEAILILKSVNHGNVKKGELMDHFGNLFNINLSGHKDLLTTIQRRSELPNEEYPRIVYLKRMIEALDVKIKELENKRSRLR